MVERWRLGGGLGIGRRKGGGFYWFVVERRRRGRTLLVGVRMERVVVVVSKFR